MDDLTRARQLAVIVGCFFVTITAGFSVLVLDPRPVVVTLAAACLLVFVSAN